MNSQRMQPGEIADQAAVQTESYEPPKVTLLGHVSDLLAGASGQNLDADCMTPRTSNLCEDPP
jgi:hypothetical protein